LQDPKDAVEDTPVIHAGNATDAKTVASGTAATDLEARIAADEATKRLEAEASGFETG
jgi:hypothetical protein